VPKEDSTETRPRRGDRGLFGMCLLFAGVVWFFSRAGMLHVAADTLLSILLICIGAGLLLTRRSGRRFWPILLGGVVLFVLMGSSASARVHWGSSGQPKFAPTSPSELHKPYELGAGQMRLDLTRMVFANTVQVQAKVGAGQLEVVVPSDIPVTVRYQEGVGGINVEGHALGNGFLSQGTWPASEHQSSSRSIELDLEVGAGHIDVTAGGMAAISPAPTRPPSPKPAPSPELRSSGSAT
jgi:hypothetical protein